MSRNHGRLLTEILSDPDFQTLSEGAQRLYMILLPQRDLNTAGILSINYRRWSRSCSTTTPEYIRELAHELHDRRYVLLDEDTEEAFIRSLIRRDGITQQPQMMKNALRMAAQVESLRLRAEMAAELRRLGREDASATADAIDPGGPPPNGPPTDSPNGATNLSPIQAHGSLPEPSADPERSHTEACAQVGGVGVGVGVVVPVGYNSSSLFTSEQKSSDPTPPAEPKPPKPRRIDVERLVDRLRTRLVENGIKVPTGFERWRDQARWLIDIDKRDLDQALRLIDWATSHHFWCVNIQSMDKFRKQYDKLLTQARQEHHHSRAGSRRTTDDKIADVSGLVDKVYGTPYVNGVVVLDRTAIAGGPS